MALELNAADPQDVAEVFDEDNLDSDSNRLARNDEELNFDDLPDVYDATTADGDEDDEHTVIGDDLDDDEIVELSLEDADEGEDGEDDAYRASETGDDIDEDSEEDGEVELSYAGDLNTVPGAHSAAQRYESRNLSDEDLADLGYGAAPKEKPSSEEKDRRSKAREDAEAEHQDELLDAGVEETFPASDPVAVKHIS